MSLRTFLSKLTSPVNVQIIDNSTDNAVFKFSYDGNATTIDILNDSIKNSTVNRWSFSSEKKYAGAYNEISLVVIVDMN